MPTFHRTPHTIKSLTLRLSLAEGIGTGDLQGKRYRITVPLNGLVFDNHATTPAWFYAVFPPQLGSGSVPVPAGIRLTGSQPVMHGADSGDPRQAIVSRLTFDIEFTSDAAAFESLPLIVKGYAAATNAPASFSLPAFTPSPDAPFVVADADGGALATGIAVEELSVFASDSELLQGEDADYYLDRANHTGTQAMGTVTGLGTALNELAEASLPPGGDTGQVLAKASATHYDVEWIDPPSGGGGTGVGNQRPIEQAGHGLAAGDWVRHDGTAYIKAQADSAGNAEVLGIVNAVDGTDAFTLASDGYVEGLSGLAPGTVYFLSPDAAGEMTASEPATVGQVSRPVFLAVAATAGYILNYRGYVVPDTESSDGTFGTDALPWYQELHPFYALNAGLSNNVLQMGIGDSFPDSHLTIFENSGTLGEAVYKISLAAGTWDILISAKADALSGIITIRLDADVVGTIDFYSFPGDSIAKVKTLTGVVVDETKEYLLKLKVESENENVSVPGGYSVSNIDRIVLRRTA